MFNKLKSFKLVIFLSIFCIGLCIFTFLSFINSKSLSFLNGNLQILLILDVVLLSTFLFIIFRKSIQVTKWYRNSLDFERTYLFIIIYALIASIYETLITGINEFHTILFWISLSFLSFLKYRAEHEN